MILVIGGAYQGKEKFAESLREQEKKAGRERTIVPQFHEWVKNCMKAEQNINYMCILRYTMALTLKAILF